MVRVEEFSLPNAFIIAALNQPVITNVDVQKDSIIVNQQKNQVDYCGFHWKFSIKIYDYFVEVQLKIKYKLSVMLIENNCECSLLEVPTPLRKKLWGRLNEFYCHGLKVAEDKNKEKSLILKNKHGYLCSYTADSLKSRFESRIACGG
jgi:hypothetical protein